MIALGYHDVVEHSRREHSGFKGADAAHYKVSPDTLRAHLSGAGGKTSSLLVTFDDGGVSAIESAADILESLQIRGFFFVVSSLIGTPGFLDHGQILELHRRGHRIGTHTETHPIPISALPYRQIFREWHESRARLEDCIGSAVTAAAVPGGFTSTNVFRAAEDAGLDSMFTSDPTKELKQFGNLKIYGRFAVTQSTSLATIRSVAAGSSLPWIRQRVLWEAKKVAKAIGGKTWLQARKAYFRHIHRPPDG